MNVKRIPPGTLLGPAAAAGDGGGGPERNLCGLRNKRKNYYEQYALRGSGGRGTKGDLQSHRLQYAERRGGSLCSGSAAQRAY